MCRAALTLRSNCMLLRTKCMLLRTKRMSLRSNSVSLRSKNTSLRTKRVFVRTKRMSLRTKRVFVRTKRMSLRTKSRSLRSNTLSLRSNTLSLRSNSVSHPWMQQFPKLLAHRAQLVDRPDHSRADDVLHFAEVGHVLRRVSGKDDEIGVFALLDRPDARVEAHGAGRDECGGRDHLHRRHAVGLHLVHLAVDRGAVEVGRVAGVGAGGNREAGGHQLPEVLRHRLRRFRGARLHARDPLR